MLTCPNCGTENRYGAIFCRVCGKKLDIIDEITVENIEEKTGRKRRRRRKDKSGPTPAELRKKGIIINAVRIVVILLLVAAVYFTQQAPPVSAIPTSEAGKKTFIEAKRQLQAAIKADKSQSVRVTEQQLNSYVAGVVPDIKEGKVVRVENVQVALGNGEENIAIRMYVRVFGKRMLFELFGTLKKSDGHVKFSAAPFAKIGKLPYPALLMKWHCRNVLDNLKGDTDLFNKLTEASVKEVKVRRAGKVVGTPGLELKVSGKS